MYSMTGYGQAAAEEGQCRVTVTMRSVNHRYLDIALRLPEMYRQQESAIREAIGEHLSRGRIDVRVEVDDRRARSVKVEIDASWLTALEETVKRLQSAGHAQDGLQFRDLLRIPEALLISSDDQAAGELPLALIDAALSDAMEQLLSARASEGRQLSHRLSERLSGLGERVRQISTHQDEISEKLTARFKARWQELTDGAMQLDESRLAQEIALQVERSDVREELDRLMAHEVHFKEVMVQDGPVGKRLDFLAQEILRELTTLSSKCRDTSVLEPTLDAKLLCEQLREQIQNIE